MGSSESRHEVEVYGFDGTRPGTMFYVLHIMALVILITSTLVSVCLVIFLFKVKPNKNLFKWPIGERLVVYLAISNLLYSIVHIFDHSYMLAIEYHPPIKICMLFAFFLQSCALAQALVVLFTAFNAFLMVVKGKKIPLGKYDCGLFLYAFGIPFTIGFVGLGVPFLGPSGAWCNVDMGRSYGPIVNNIYSGAMLLTILVNVICYGMVWTKIKQAAKSQSKAGTKYHKSAKVMMLFVAVYIGQWLPYVIYSTWNIFSLPSVYFMAVAIFFSNMGGVFNFLAYILIRIKYQRQTAPQQSNMATLQGNMTSST